MADKPLSLAIDDIEVEVSLSFAALASSPGTPRVRRSLVNVTPVVCVCDKRRLVAIRPVARPAKLGRVKPGRFTFKTR